MGRRRNVEADFWKKVAVASTGTCWLWQGTIHHTGYGVFRMWIEGLPKNVPAHRASWIYAHGPIPEGLLVCHTCDVRSCVNPNHLFLGTPADNSRDMVSKGRSASGDDHPARARPETRPRGAGHGRAKLTAADVRKMRRLRNTKGLSFPELGRRFGVSRTAARLAVIGKTWSHLK